MFHSNGAGEAGEERRRRAGVGFTVSDDGADEGPRGGLPGEAEEADPGGGGGRGQRARVPRHREARQDRVVGRAGPARPHPLRPGLVGGVGFAGVAVGEGVVLRPRVATAARHGRRSAVLVFVFARVCT